MKQRECITLIGGAAAWMNRRTVILKSAAMIWLAVATPLDDVVAQQTQRVFIHASGENAKYTQQQAIDVPDMHDHQLRVYEVRLTFPTNPPIVNGLAIKEIWTRGMSDYTEDNGHGSLYSEYLMENGDRFFSVQSVVARRIGPDDFLSNSVGYTTGGIGKLAGIQGVLYTTAKTHHKAGTLELDMELEYTVGASDSAKNGKLLHRE